MKLGFVSAAVLSLSLCVTAPCSASVIIASGAGPTLATAEDLTGLFPTEILGTLDGVNQNATSIFKLIDYQPGNFSAITVDAGPLGIPDTVLSLFNSSGVGIYLNDDISGSNTLSCLPSSGKANPCPTMGAVLPVGTYYLAISRSANYPLDNLGSEIFNPLSSTDVVGPSSTHPVASWDGGTFTSPDFDLVNYDIVLTGTTVPEPGTWLMGVMGVVLAGVLVRRRN